MNVIKKKTLEQYWMEHRDSEQSLKAWYHEAQAAAWKTPADVKQRYPNADILPHNRVVFNIKGNRYRLVVQIVYPAGKVFVRFIGTHAEYDKIDAEKI